jgi:hypothetical protein
MSRWAAWRWSDQITPRISRHPDVPRHLMMMSACIGTVASQTQTLPWVYAHQSVRSKADRGPERCPDARRGAPLWRNGVASMLPSGLT